MAENTDLIEQFKTEINNRSFDVDPEGEEDWHSLTVGWAIAKGLEPDAAISFAHYIRYKTDLG